MDNRFSGNFVVPLIFQNDLFRTTVKSKLCKFAFTLSSFASWSVETGRCTLRGTFLNPSFANQIEFRHENHRGPIVYPITETLLCGISRVWAFDRTVSIRHSLWHQARAIDPGIFRPLPFIYLSTLPASTRTPSDRCDSIFTSHNRRARAGPV